MKSKLSPSTRKPSSSASSELGSHGKEIGAISLFLFSVFVAISLLKPGSTGFVGHALVDIVFIQLFGQATKYLPYFLTIGSLAYLFGAHRTKRLFLALGISFLFFCVLTELIIRGESSIFAWPLPTDGGGWLGYLGLFGLFHTMGINGTKIVLTGSWILSLIIIFDTSLLKVFLNSFKGVGWFYRSSIFQKGIRPLLYKLVVTLFYVKKESQSHPLLQKSRPVKPLKPTPIQFDLPQEPDEPDAEPLDLNEEVVDLVPDEKPKRATKTKLANPSDYKLPKIELLEKGQQQKRNTKTRQNELQEQAQLLEAALGSFNVDATVVNVTPGPSVTRYELKPGEGVKVSKITNLSKDIALKLAAADVRIEAPIPGKALVGIEVPNSVTQTITLRQLLTEADFYDPPSKLLTGLGLTITGEAIYMNLAKMPHILIAGATGAGKSVCINTIILSILMKAHPDEVKFLMIDPKKVELSLYNDIPHLLAPVVTDPNKAAATLKKWALVEMERRYELFSLIGVKEIDGYNRKIKELEEQNQTDPEGVKSIFETVYKENWEEIYNSEKAFQPLPQIVVIIDELADLMMVASQEVETTICRLAQMARATGIHLVIATQRPSVNVITGLIKANVPSRISFFLQSQIDSRTILDAGGAEKLLGKGDMLYLPVGAFKPKRLQGVFISEEEVKRVVAFVKTQASPDYAIEIDEIEPIGKSEKTESSASDGKDELFEQAKELVRSTQYASTSYLQRKLRIGYNRAARLMDELEEDGTISAYDGDKKTRVVNL